jgi:hypothetical protein
MAIKRRGGFWRRTIWEGGGEKGGGDVLISAAVCPVCVEPLEEGIHGRTARHVQSGSSSALARGLAAT